ncbi:MAG: peptide ABC transporter substrate-binding protein [Candidatus Rokubacteria bacterium]|nr:peptide ABC transporter substrate-binding protein [Candidatus Rokubacteria bacterium]
MHSAKLILLAAPTLVSLLLLQSYLWVPTFEDQARGDPGRLTRYISVSSGDASILNPTLSADSASSEVNNLVFEGLIDRNLDLSFRGRLAESWRIFEEAYLSVDESLRLSDGSPVTARALLERLTAAKASRAPALRLVEQIEVVPAETVRERVEPPGDRPPGRPAPAVEVTIRRPARIKFTLSEVDQDFFAGLDRLLGGYVKALETRDPGRFVTAPDPATARAIGAERVPATEPNPVIVFRLRRGVRFHDGHEFGSGDVRFTYETIVGPRNLSPRVPDFEPVKAVETPDRYTVRITYQRLFQPGFESWGMGVLPEHLLNQERLREEALAAGRDPTRFTVRDSGFNRRPIGTGMFRFVEWKSDVSIRLVRFDDHWEGPPNFKEYLIRIIPDSLTTELAFYAGAADAYGAQPHQVARLRNDPRFHAVSRLALGYTYIGYNMRRPIFQDVRVRRALGMAINVDEIIRYVLYGQGERTTGPFPRQTDYYDPSVGPLPYDPAGAARLLAEAGWKKNAAGILEKDGRPLAFTIITNSGNEERNAIMVIAQNAWRRLGVKVEALSLEWAVFINQRVDKGDFDAVVLGWAMGLDPDIYQIFHSSQTGHFQLNFVGYQNPKADALMVRIRQEYDYARQVAMARELHRLIAEDQPYTFLYVRRALSLMDAKIVRMVRDPDGTPRYLPFVPDKLGRLGFYFREWVKTPRPVLPPFRPELSPA